MLVLYVVQGEAGDELAHPNAFDLPWVAGQQAAAPRVRDVTDAFPLRSTGVFHFRFRVACESLPVSVRSMLPKPPQQYVWLDLDADARVPVVGGAVFAKVLRIGESPLISICADAQSHLTLR